MEEVGVLVLQQAKAKFRNAKERKLAIRVVHAERNHTLAEKCPEHLKKKLPILLRKRCVAPAENSPWRLWLASALTSSEDFGNACQETLVLGEAVCRLLAP